MILCNKFYEISWWPPRKDSTRERETKHDYSTIKVKLYGHITHDHNLYSEGNIHRPDFFVVVVIEQIAVDSGIVNAIFRYCYVDVFFFSFVRYFLKVCMCFFQKWTTGSVMSNTIPNIGGDLNSQHNKQLNVSRRVWTTTPKKTKKRLNMAFIRPCRPCVFYAAPLLHFLFAVP